MGVPSAPTKAGKWGACKEMSGLRSSQGGILSPSRKQFSHNGNACPENDGGAQYRPRWKFEGICKVGEILFLDCKDLID